MTAILLAALFATVAVASAATLADAAVRGRNAFRLLRGDAARIAAGRRITVTFVDAIHNTPLPPLRAISGGRAPGRVFRVQAPKPLRAAA